MSRDTIVRKVAFTSATSPAIEAIDGFELCAVYVANWVGTVLVFHGVVDDGGSAGTYKVISNNAGTNLGAVAGAADDEIELLSEETIRALSAMPWFKIVSDANENGNTAILYWRRRAYT